MHNTEQLGKIREKIMECPGVNLVISTGDEEGQLLQIFMDKPSDEVPESERVAIMGLAEGIRCDLRFGGSPVQFTVGDNVTGEAVDVFHADSAS